MNLKYSQNTVAKHIRTLKVFLNAATESGDNTNLIFRSKKFRKPNEEVTKIYLTESEINRLLDLVNFEVIEMPLVLDGGNLVTNGEIAFISDKIYSDNKALGKNVKNIIRNYLGVEPIVIPTNKHDKLSHSDGYLNFLDKNRICISKYPEIAFLKDDIEYSNILRSIVENNELEVITIDDRPVAEKVIGGGKTENDKSINCLNSARGIYVNFLILNDVIILPEYSIPNYKKTLDYNSFNKKSLEALGYQVLSINFNELAKLRGSIRCATFTA